MLINTRRLGVLALVLAAAALTAALVAAAWQWQIGRQLAQRDELLRARLEQRVGAGPAHGAGCAPAEPTATPTTQPASPAITILVLGQSNAGNHGQLDADAPMLELLSADGHCLRTRAPLPGGTGDGGAIWPYLNQDLKRGHRPGRPLRWSLLAIDASSIEDWTREHSPLRRQLIAQLAELRASGHAPDLVLWQQGEADAQRGSSRQDYLEGLLRLSELLADAQIQAPLLLAKSTLCRSAPNEALREAIDEAIRGWPARFRAGANTDALTGTVLRRDGCHFSQQGLQQAARLWLPHLDQHLSPLQAAR